MKKSKHVVTKAVLAFVDHDALYGKAERIVTFPRTVAGTAGWIACLSDKNFEKLKQAVELSLTYRAR